MPDDHLPLAPRRADVKLRRAFATDIGAANLAAGAGDESLVSAGDLAHLEPPVRRYFEFMAVVGRPRVWSFEAEFVGRFRLRPKTPWMAAHAYQFNSVAGIARIFTMRLRFGRVISMLGHDTYVDGRGRMIGRLFDRFTVADGSGIELDIGEQSTWLNDAVLLAPSMLLAAPVRWAVIDDHTFDITLTDAGRDVTARVTTDERGAPVDYTTTDRWADLPGGLVRAQWRTPVTGWDMVDGRPIPRPGSAVWDLPNGPFTYVEGGVVPVSIQVNLSPDDAAV